MHPSRCCHDSQLELKGPMDFDAGKGLVFCLDGKSNRERQALSHAWIHPTVRDVCKQIHKDIGKADEQQTALH